VTTQHAEVLLVGHDEDNIARSVPTFAFPVSNSNPRRTA
jgi:hypothetical protein